MNITQGEFLFQFIHNDDTRRFFPFDFPSKLALFLKASVAFHRYFEILHLDLQQRGTSGNHGQSQDDVVTVYLHDVLMRQLQSLHGSVIDTQYLILGTKTKRHNIIFIYQFLQTTRPVLPFIMPQKCIECFLKIDIRGSEMVHYL